MVALGMKKLIFPLLAFVAGLAQADPYDVTVRQRNAADNGYLDRFIKFPVSGESCLFSLDGPTILPNCYTLGSGLTLSSGVISVSAGGGQMQADWAQANNASADYIKNKPVLFSGSYADLTGKPTLFDGAYSSLTGVPAAFTPSAHNQAWSTITSTPTTLAGYGITDATSASQLSTALSSYATNSALTSGLAGKQNTITLTTSGSGAASLVGSTLNIPTPVAAAQFNFSQPTARTLAVSTSYQALDNTKAAIIVPSYACQNATTVLAASGCTIQVRMGTGTLTCSTGTVYYTQSLTVQLGVLITQNSTNPVQINLPIGGSFILCATTGTFTISAVEQSAG